MKIAVALLAIGLGSAAAEERIILESIDVSGIRLVRPAGSRAAKTTPKPKPRPAPPSLSRQIPLGKFAADLADGTRLVGKPSQTATLGLKLDFAELQIPLTRIKSVAATKVRGQHTVVFANGDRMTGTLVGEELRFGTKFGEVSFPLRALAKLTAGEQGAPTPSVAAAKPVAKAASQNRSRPPAARIPVRFARPAAFAPADIPVGK